MLTGAGEWSNKQVMRSDSYKIVTDIVRTGNYAARVEVRPGDNPLSCCAGSERAEMHTLSKSDWTDMFETPASGTKYFGFSVRLAEDFQVPEWSVLFQLHGPDNLNTNPSVAIDLLGENFVFANRGGNITAQGSTNQHYTISPIVRGQWVDFIVKIKFAGDSTGAVTIWQRVEGQTTFTQVLDLPTIATLQHAGGAIGNHYWKFGYYRKAANFTNVLWNDGFVRADSFEEILNYFGATTPPPPSSQDIIAPSVPTGLSATAASQASINLSWSASSDNVGVAGYNIYQNGTRVGTSQGTSYTNTGLTAGTAYSYQVSAFDAAGNTSAQSASASATTQATQYSVTVEAENMQTKSVGYVLPDGFWNLNSNGYISHPITFPANGNYTFDIVARGTRASGTWPNMRVSVDNVVKSKVSVNSSTEKTFPVTVTNITAGQHILKLEFTNDYYNKRTKEDRNLYIDKMTVKSSIASSMLSILAFAIADTMSVAGIKLTAIISAAVELLAGAPDVGLPTQSV